MRSANRCSPIIRSFWMSPRCQQRVPLQAVGGNGSESKCGRHMWRDCCRSTTKTSSLPLKILNTKSSNCSTRRWKIALALFLSCPVPLVCIDTAPSVVLPWKPTLNPSRPGLVNWVPWKAINTWRKIVSCALNCWPRKVPSGRCSMSKNAIARTNVPTNLIDLIPQRRRWLNGSFFATLFVLNNWGRIYSQTKHGFIRKIAFMIQYLYYLFQTAFNFVLPANFYLAVYFLGSEKTSGVFTTQKPLTRAYVMPVRLCLM